MRAKKGTKNMTETTDMKSVEVAERVRLLGENENGIPFASIILNKGDRYGLNKCLTHEEEKPMVEFWDLRFEHEPIQEGGTTKGQFVGRYYVSTIKGEDEFGGGREMTHGINLDGGIPDWFVDPRQVKQAIEEDN
jgi:hypothetical protein